MANDLAEPATGFRVRPGLALLVLGGSIALDVSALALLNAALPLIGEDFGISTAVLQWTMTSYAVTFAGFLLLGGRAADVLGRRRMFAIGVGLFVAAAFAGAFAPGIGVLIIARAVQGIGAALTGPAALALLTEVFPAGPGRDRAFAVFGSIGAASFSGGLIFGGVLTDLLSWRAVFLLSGVFGLVVLAATRAALPPSVRHPHSLDLAGAALVTGGMVLTVFGIGRGPENGWSDPVTIGSLVVAAVLLAGFLVRERRAAEPLLQLSIFRLPTVQAATLAAFLHYAAVIALLFFAPLYMQDVLGYSPLMSGLAVVPMGLTVIVSSTITGKLMPRYGTRPFLVFGMPLIAIGVLMWAWTPVDGNYLLHVLPGIVVMSVGQGTTFPALTAASLADVPQNQHGVAGAANVTTQQIGSSIGVSALVAVAAAFTTPGETGELAGFHAAYIVAAAVVLVGTAGIAVILRRPSPARAADTVPVSV